MLSFRTLLHVLCNKVSSLLRSEGCSYLYYTEWIIHWHQKFTFHNVFSVQILFTCKSHICWLDAIRLGSFCETQIIKTEMVCVNKQNTHTHTPNTQRKIYKLERVSMKIRYTPFFKITPYFTNLSLFMEKIWVDLNTPPFSKILKNQTSLFTKGRLQLG